MNIEITELTRRFGRTMAVAGVDLQAGPGVYGLLGPNGAGKTSLLRMMATVIPPSSGKLRLLDRDPGQYGPRREIRRGSATCRRAWAITRASRCWNSSSTSRC